MVRGVPAGACAAVRCRRSFAAFAAFALVAGFGALQPVVADAQRSARPAFPAMVTDAAPGIDVLDYDIAIEFAPPTGVIQGVATITLRRTAAVPSLRLDFVGLEATSVTVAGVAQPVRADSTGLTVALGPGANDERVIVVRYQGTPRDGMVIRTNARAGWTAFADNFPSRARHWFPSVDHPSDKATVSFTVRVPTSYLVIANGALLDRTEVDGPTSTTTSNVWRFREKYPIPTSLMVIGVAELSVVELGETACGLGDEGGCVTQFVLVEPASKGSFPANFARAGEIVQYFATLFGPFPYEKLAHVQSATRYGGMENAAAIFYAWNLFQAPNTVGEGLIAHETAHQWFGDAVTERAWAHLWLSEGFATYLNAMWMEHAHGDSARVAELVKMRRAVVGSAAARERPVIDTAEQEMSRLLNANSYQKGGLVLHMLRRTVGDSAFVRGLRSYQAQFKHGTALTDDLRVAVEREHGAPLGWFFDQWLRRPGWAELEVGWAVRDGRLELEIAQSKRFGDYRLALPVRVTRSDGSVVDFEVQVPASPRTLVRSSVAFEAGSVREVALDPNGDLLATHTVRRLGNR